MFLLKLDHTNKHKSAIIHSTYMDGHIHRASHKVVIFSHDITEERKSLYKSKALITSVALYHTVPPPGSHQVKHYISHYIHVICKPPPSLLFFLYLSWSISFSLSIVYSLLCFLEIYVIAPHFLSLFLATQSSH